MQIMEGVVRMQPDAAEYLTELGYGVRGGEGVANIFGCTLDPKNEPQIPPNVYTV